MARASVGNEASPVLSRWLSPKYEYPQALTKGYAAAKPFPHAVLRGFFKPAKAEALRAAVLKLARNGAFVRKESDLFSLAQTHDLLSEEKGAIADLVALFASPEWSHYVKALTATRLTNKQLDIGGSLYTDTDFLLCHDDRVTGRKIAYIYYVCDDFGVADGGALVLLDSKGKKPGIVAKRYPPQFNTLALFTVSEKSWHAVEEVLTKEKRYSINGWFH